MRYQLVWDSALIHSQVTGINWRQDGEGSWLLCQGACAVTGRSTGSHLSSHASWPPASYVPVRRSLRKSPYLAMQNGPNRVHFSELLWGFTKEVLCGQQCALHKWALDRTSAAPPATSESSAVASPMDTGGLLAELWAAWLNQVSHIKAASTVPATEWAGVIVSLELLELGRQGEEPPVLSASAAEVLRRFSWTCPKTWRDVPTSPCPVTLSSQHE